MKDTKKFFVKNMKPLLVAAVVIAVAVALFVCIRKAREAIEKRNLKNDASNLTGTQVTEGLHHGELLAAIAEACRGLGTDEEAIYAALRQVRTQADWEYMKTAWSASIGELPSWQGVMTRLAGISQSLTATLANELTKKELQKCRDILIGNGIEPGF